MSIKIDRELTVPEKEHIYNRSKSTSDILYKAKVIINNSSSKAMYSFPLSKRFEIFKVDNSTFFYNKPSTLNQRKAFIGYGKRSTILIPKSGKTDKYYDIPPTIDANSKSGSPKYTFGFSRAVCREPQCLDQRVTPGPSNYYPRYERFGDNVKYSMSFRYKYKKDPDNYNFPGPGTYELPSFNKSGVYSISNFKNSQCPKFPEAKRFNDYDHKTPGPGAYDYENLVKGNGVIFNSKFVSSNGKTMGKKLKFIKNQLITPGPGAYESFSEFHGFDRKNYVKIRKDNIYGKGKNKVSSCSSRATSALSMRTRHQ
jgi:hypothetical protein